MKQIDKTMLRETLQGLSTRGTLVPAEDIVWYTLGKSFLEQERKESDIRDNLVHARQSVRDLEHSLIGQEGVTNTIHVAFLEEHKKRIKRLGDEK